LSRRPPRKSLFAEERARQKLVRKQATRQAKPVSPTRRRLALLRYVRPHRAMALTVFAMVLLSVGIGLMIPWPMKLLVDNVLSDKPLPGVIESVLEFLPGPDDATGLLVWIALASMAIFMLRTLAEFAQSLAAIRLSQRMTYDLAADVFLHLQRLSLIFHSRRPVGDTIRRVNDDTYTVQIMVGDVIMPVVQSALTLIFMFVIMLQLSVPLTLMALAVVPFQVLAIRAFGGSMQRRSRERLDLEGSMMSVVQQTLTSVPVVQAFTREELEQQRFRRFADRTVLAYVRETLAGLWFRLFVGLATALGTAAIMYFGARYALDGKITIGTILIFLAYLTALYEPLDSITHTASTYQIAAAQADRVLEILESPRDVEDGPHARPRRIERGAVRFDNVGFAYEESRPVLQEISFAAAPGEVVAIVGPTGAGKTTLINLLVRFFDPAEGRIEIDGVDIRDFTHRSLREQIALVLQDAFILPLTIAENIAYGRPQASRKEIIAAAEAANAHDFITRLPDGYDTLVGERGTTLSGGEQQRLSIARAFLKDAPILVLDEPTSALDARTEGALLEALERLSAGRTSFIIAHRLSTIRNADRILVIDRGRLVEQGRHDDLARGDGLYASLYRQQMDQTRHTAIAP
jgi:ATP-binding cassette, subfamily B, bacterial